MLASIALTLAIAFWQPYSPEPVCPNGVQISYFSDGDHPTEPGTIMWGWAEIGGGCTITVNRRLIAQSIEFQCEVEIHELGHAVFNLEHTATGIMAAMLPDNPPGVCYGYKHPRPVRRWAHHRANPHPHPQVRGVRG